MSSRNQETDVVERSNTEDSPPSASNERKKSSRSLQRRPEQPVYDAEDSELDDFVAPPPRKNRRMIPVHQSRISDRPIKKGAEDSSLKIKIELDLEVEVIFRSPLPNALMSSNTYQSQVKIYARVKGDVTIGLM